MPPVSKAEVSRICRGMNKAHIDELTRLGFLPINPQSTPLRPKFNISDISLLKENIHFVVCQVCGSWAGQISQKHLKVCSDLDLSTYKGEYPEAVLMCAIIANNRAKTTGQKLQQSEKLKARFQTPEGQETRRQISNAARKKMLSGYREINAERLRVLNQTPKRRLESSQDSKARWERGTQRESVVNWHKNNKAESEAGIAFARKSINPENLRKHLHNLHSRKTSTLHLNFKKFMLTYGLSEFQTECCIGPFTVDEVHPRLRIALEIDGCYWHGCEKCSYAGVKGTLRNDKRKSAFLESQGWAVLRIAEHTILKNPKEGLDSILSLITTLEGVKC